MNKKRSSLAHVILHVDMDAFFAAIEQRDHLEWRGRPVAVGAAADRRGVVSAASYEARAFGIHSAMPSREAYRRCPHAVFVPPDMPRYQAVSRQMFAILARYTPLIEPLSVDEAFLDVTGSQGLFGDGQTIARRIRSDIQRELHLTASVGVAPNKFLAKLASELHKPDGLTVTPCDPADIARFLAPLPVSRIWGVGTVLQRQLAGMGLHTIGALQDTAESDLRRVVGCHTARHLRLLALGIDARNVETESEAKSLSHEQTFDTDCRNPVRIRRVLLSLSQAVGSRLRAENRYASRAKLKLRWSDFRTLTRQTTFSPPVCDDDALIAAALMLLQKIPLSRPVRLIGFGVDGLTDAPSAQLQLFDDEPLTRPKREALSRAIDAIRLQHGRERIQRAAELETESKC